MEKEKTKKAKQIIVTASYYEEKYFLNPEFVSLPKEIQKELIEISIVLAQKIRGIFMIAFNEEGNVILEIRSIAGGYDFDEIGGELEIKKIQREKQDLWNSLEYWYKWIYLSNHGR